jgi:hypothetical protein
MALSPTTWVAHGADGRLEVFVVGIDHGGSESLWHRRQTARGVGWSDWFSHGAPPDSNGLRWSPAVASSADGRLQIVIVGDDLQPEGSDPVGPSTTSRRPPETTSGPVGVHTRRAGRTCLDRLPLRPTPMDAWSCSC